MPSASVMRLGDGRRGLLLSALDRAVVATRGRARTRARGPELACLAGTVYPACPDGRASAGRPAGSAARAAVAVRPGRSGRRRGGPEGAGRRRCASGAGGRRRASARWLRLRPNRRTYRQRTCGRRLAGHRVLDAKPPGRRHESARSVWMAAADGGATGAAATGGVSTGPCCLHGGSISSSARLDSSHRFINFRGRRGLHVGSSGSSTETGRGARSGGPGATGHLEARASASNAGGVLVSCRLV